MNYNKFIFLIIALIGVCGAKETDKKDLTDGQIWYLFIYNIYKVVCYFVSFSYGSYRICMCFICSFVPKNIKN